MMSRRSAISSSAANRSSIDSGFDAGVKKSSGLRGLSAIRSLQSVAVVGDCATPRDFPDPTCAEGEARCSARASGLTFDFWKDLNV
jgi:hypothetical protein